VHPVHAEGRGRVLHQRDVVPELHRESAGGFDARVGQQANQGITDRDHAWYFVNE
jgi:hypothetical protein